MAADAVPSLYSYSRKMDRALASFDGSRLRGLHFLDLGASSRAARVPVELGWVRGHPELVGLLLAGVWPRGLSLEEVFDLTAGVPGVSLVTTDRHDIARLEHSPPPPNVEVQTFSVPRSRVGRLVTRRTA
jgi:hypothetical protein